MAKRKSNSDATLEDLEKDIRKNPENYTHWLKLCLNKLISATTSD